MAVRGRIGRIVLDWSGPCPRADGMAGGTSSPALLFTGRAGGVGGIPMSSAEEITDHDRIRKWAEERGGRPSVAKGTEKGGEGAGVLRFDFGPKEESLEEIDWDSFFETFEEKKLA